MLTEKATTLDGVEYYQAKCCRPVPGDAVFGYVTRNRGISLHRSDCLNAKDLRNQTERIIEIDWPSQVFSDPGSPSAPGLFLVPIHLETADAPGILATIVQAISAERANIRQIEAASVSGRAEMSVCVEVADRKQLSSIHSRLQEVEGVLRILARGKGEEFTEEVFEAAGHEDGPVVVRPLIVGVNEHLLMLAHEQPRLLRELTPRLFEEFVAELFDGFGYQVELTAHTRDGGRDIVAVRKHDDILLKYLIECKFYAPPNSVGVGYVRKLLGVKYDEGASKAILATTSTFTASARELQERHIYELELKDYAGVMEWVRLYNRIRRGEG